MLVKTTFTIAMALTLGLTSAALAARSGGNGRGGSRELANGQIASSGINPAQHRALAAPKAPLITSEGKCFVNTSNGNYNWTDCRTEARAVAVKGGRRAFGKKPSG
jgi:hypothetical protein